MFKENCIRNVALGCALKNNKLLVEKGIDKVKGITFYRCIGGGIETNELPIEAVKREFNEELNFDIIVNKPLGIIDNTFTYNGKQGHEIVHLFDITIPEKNYKEKYTIQLEDGTKLNNSKDLKDVKKYRTIEISNIQVTSTNGNTTILADAKNTGNETFEREIVTLILIDDEGMQVAEIPAVIPKIEAGRTGKINANVSSADVSNIKDFEIKER